MTLALIGVALCFDAFAAGAFWAADFYFGLTGFVVCALELVFLPSVGDHFFSGAALLAVYDAFLGTVELFGKDTFYKLRPWIGGESLFISASWSTLTNSSILLTESISSSNS